MSMLIVDRVGKRFGGLQALDDVSFAVPRGAIVGLMGANGAGKTTLFSLIAGNERPSSGDIRVDGRSIVGLRPDQIARCGVARTFQIVRPFAGITVFENAFTAAIFGAGRHATRASAAAAADDALALAGLAHRRDDLAAKLTLSDQKRLEIARAVATGAELILLDEVMAGLTPAEVERMLDVVRALRDERRLTVVIIEHVMRALMRLADDIVVLHLGRKIAQGAPEAIGNDAAVRQAYLGADL